MKNFRVALPSVVLFLLWVAPVTAQATGSRLEAASLPPLVQVRQRVENGGNNAVLRTLAAIAGSAGGFALANSQSSGEPDDITVPMAAAVAGGAIGTMIISNILPGVTSSAGSAPPVGPLRVELEAPAGSTLGYTAGKAREVATTLGGLPRVTLTQTTIRQDDAGGFSTAELSAILLPATSSSQSERELVALTQEALRAVTGVRTYVVPTVIRRRSPNPFQVIAGSVLGALPGAALAMYLVGVTEDEEQDKLLPLVAFSIPHGLFTSAFGQSR